MRQLLQTSQFVRDVKRMKKRGKDLGKLQDVVRQLAGGVPLPPRLRDHPLNGPWQDSRDCHLEPDWVLIYRPSATQVCLERTGTHSDLFEW